MSVAPSITLADGYAGAMTTVLVVDDDPTVSEVVTTYLQHAGFSVQHCVDGEAALDAVSTSVPDLVVLDLMLPGIDGLEVCRRLRTKADVPVVMLTALGDEVDRVLGLEVGADDYITKPFSPRELVLRVQSVLRRTGGGSLSVEEPSVLEDGDLIVDQGAHRASKSGELLSLTAREFDLLAFFMANPGTAFTREQLMEQVWGWSFGDQSTVTVHVRRLREKIEPNPSESVRLVTVWGVGYRWDPTHGR
jgi:DNA-binding response OmpR family regulator